MIIMHGVPKEWKSHQERAKCVYCGTEMWTHDGQMPPDHDRPDGRVCRRAMAKADLAYCDCCGEVKLNVEPVVAFGMDTSACGECRDPQGEDRIKVRRRMDSMGR